MMGFQLLRRHPLPVTFFLLALLILGTRWHTRLEPLDRDISAYAVIGREMLNGRPLYSDLWDHKPPGIHLIFAGATVASSPGTPAVLLVNLVCSIAALAGFMVAGRRLAGTAGTIISGGLWVLIGGDLGLHANQPNVELPLNACVAWALATSLGPADDKRASPQVSGGITGFALLLKPVVGPSLGLLALVELVQHWGSQGAAEALGRTGRWLLGAATPIAAVLGWAILRAGVAPVWEALVVFNAGYGKGSLLLNMRELVHIGDHLPTSSLVWLGLLLVAAIPGLVSMTPVDRAKIIAVFAGSVVAVTAPGRFYPHYYQLLLPALVLAAATGMARGWNKGLILRLATTGVLATLAIGQLASYRLSPDEWSRRKHGEVFIEERRLAEILGPHLQPGDSLFVLDALPGLYLQTGANPASGVVYDSPLRESSPIREEITLRVLAELESHPPKIVVVRQRGGNPAVIRWIRLNYRHMGGLSPLDMPQIWILRWSPRAIPGIR